MVQKEAPSHPTTLFVRNLSPQTTKPDLSSHFSGIGPLRRTVLVTSPETGQCTGIAFIHYALPQHASAALQTLHGSMLHNRRIYLDVAKPRVRSNTDEDGGLLPKHKPVREEVKKKGALKGSVAMRTVVMEKEGVTEEEVQNLFKEMNVQNVVMMGGGTVRVRFSSWAEAGRAAAKVHGGQCKAWVEALAGGKGTRVIVRNLPFKVRRNEVRRLFEVKPVRDVWLAPSKKVKNKTEDADEHMEDAPEEDREASKDGSAKDEAGELVDCGGFGFVEYFLVADAKYAVQKLNGEKVGGRVVAVDMAIGKADYVKRVEEDEEASERAKRSERTEGSEKENQDEDMANEDASSASGESDTGDEDSDSGQEEIEPEVTLRNERTQREAKSSPEELERTVFIRNLLYETSAQELRKAMADEFGRVEQAVLVMHPVTKRPRGTAFVRFANKEDAEKAVERGAGDTSRTRSAVADIDATSFSLQGRPLMISKAVDRSKAKDLSAGSDNKKKEDPRNLRLAGLGQTLPGSPEAKGLSEEDLQRHVRWAKEKKNKLERNPNAFVSDVRLSVRNLPREVDEKVLKQLFLLGGQKVGDGKKEPVRITHCAIVRDAERNDRSKGYGFVQFERHEQAMTALKRLSNCTKAAEILIKAKPKALKIDEHRARALKKMWASRRLHVEFSIEDKRKVLMIERIKEKGRKMAEENRLKKEQESGEVSAKGNRKKQNKRKRLEKENESEHVKKKNKSEKKSSLKRKRSDTDIPPDPHAGDAGLAEEQQPKGKRERRNVAANDNEHRQDNKPKRPRRAAKAGEKEKEAKLDSLIAAYKRKLDKSLKKGPQAGNTSSGQLATSAISRWFE